MILFGGIICPTITQCVLCCLLYKMNETVRHVEMFYLDRDLHEMICTCLFSKVKNVFKISHIVDIVGVACAATRT